MFEMHNMWFNVEHEQCEKLWSTSILSSVCIQTIKIENKRKRNSFWNFFRHNPRPKPTTIVDNAEMRRIRSLNQISHAVRFWSSWINLEIFSQMFFFSFFQIKSNRNSTKTSTEIQTNVKESSIDQSNQINSLEISSDRIDHQSDVVENSSTLKSNQADLDSSYFKIFLLFFLQFSFLDFHQQLNDDRENQTNSNSIDPPLKVNWFEFDNSLDWNNFFFSFIQS